MLWNVYILIVTLSVLIGIVRFRFLNMQLKAILGIVLWVLTVEIFRKFVSIDLRILLTHVNFVVEMLLYALYFFLLLLPNKRILILAGVLLFLIALALNSELGNSNFWTQQKFTYAIAANINITLWSCLYLYELIYKPLNHKLKYDGNFWVICGNLLFYPGTLFLLGFDHYLIGKNPGLASDLQIINHLLNILLYLFILIALYLHRADRNKSNQKFNNEYKVLFLM